MSNKYFDITSAQIDARIAKLQADTGKKVVKWCIKEVTEWDQRDGLYLHHSGVPLAEADLSLPDAPEHPLFGRGEDCDAGMCWI